MFVSKRKIKGKLAIIRDKIIDLNIKKQELSIKMRHCTYSSLIVYIDEYHSYILLINEYNFAGRILISLLYPKNKSNDSNKSSTFGIWEHDIDENHNRDKITF